MVYPQNVGCYVLIIYGLWVKVKLKNAFLAPFKQLFWLFGCIFYEGYALVPIIRIL